jgi:hypothetical protein
MILPLLRATPCGTAPCAVQLRGVGINLVQPDTRVTIVEPVPGGTVSLREWLDGMGMTQANAAGYTFQVTTAPLACDIPVTQWTPLEEY